MASAVGQGVKFWIWIRTDGGRSVRAASEVALLSMADTCFPIAEVDIDRGMNLSQSPGLLVIELSKFFVTTMSKAVAVVSAVSYPPTSQWT